MGLAIVGNPTGAQILCSSSLADSLHRGRFWDEQIISGILLRFVDLVIDRPGWMKIEQTGINVSCLRHGTFASSYFRPGDADARELSLRIFTLKDTHYQLVSFAKPTRYQLVQIALDPNKLAKIAADLDEEPDTLQRILHQSCHVEQRFSVSNRPLPNSVGRLMDDVFDNPRSGFLRRLSLYGQAIEILAHTLEELCFHGEDIRHGNRFDRIEHVTERLKTEFASAPAIADLARSAGLSEDTLQREFKARYGVTPYGYLSLVRMGEAERLLRLSDTPVSEVGRLVGFANHSAFSRAYRRHFGQAPSEVQRATAVQNAVSIKQT